MLHSAELKALWDRIKHKTTYRVQFDNARLIQECVKALREAPAIPKTRIQWRKADIAIGKAGVEATERKGTATVVLEETEIAPPDLLTDLQDRTQLTRRSIYRILTESARLDDFKRNPQQFIELLRPSTATSGWPTWTESSTSGSATSTTTPKSCSSRKN